MSDPKAAGGREPASSRLLSDFLDRTAAVHLLTADLDGRVATCNRAMAGLLGSTPESIAGRPLRELLTEADGARLHARLAAGNEASIERRLLNFVDSDDGPHSLDCHLEIDARGLLLLGELPRDSVLSTQRKMIELTNSLSVLAREHARQKRELAEANSRLQAALDDLDQSYWHLRKIQEVLPICMDCGRVKTGDLQWEAVADYLRNNSLFLSHGYCPECADAAIAASEDLNAEAG